MGRDNRVSRSLLGAVVFIGVIWVLCVGISAHHATGTTRTTIPLTGNFEHRKLIGRGRHHIYQDSDLNFVIKRRVPNGPDPIHNRRASQARHPPDRI